MNTNNKMFDDAEKVGNRIMAVTDFIHSYCNRIISYRDSGKSCVNSIKTNLLGENYGRNNFYQGGFST